MSSRLMPFRTAHPESIRFRDVDVLVGEDDKSIIRDHAEWDYLTPLTVVAEFELDKDLFLSSTGLDAETGLARSVTCLQVDCLSTGERFVKTEPLTHPEHRAGRILLEIDPTRIADSIDVSLGIILHSSSPKNAHDSTVANLPGSRLFQDATRHRIQLEGSRTGFPTEALPFHAQGLPRDAAWKLRLEADDLNVPFMHSVRLMVNTSHPRHKELLSGSESTLQSVLFTSILEQMLTTVAAQEITWADVSFDEGTLGHALRNICDTYLQMDLQDAVDRIREDRSGFSARLQSELQFLRGIA